MKNLFFVIVSCIIALQFTFASPHYSASKDRNFCNSSLELRVPNHGSFKVKVDGNVYDDLRNGAIIRDIPAGKRYVKVVQFRSRNHHHRPKKHVLFEGYVIFNECQEITALVTPNNSLVIKDIINRRPDEVCNAFNVISIPPNEYVAHQIDPYYYGNDTFNPNGTCGNEVYVNPPQPNNQFCGACNSYGCSGSCNVNMNVGPQAMPEGAFINFLQALNDRSFDSQRINVAELGISQNYFTSQQVRRIMEAFTFDNKRLDVAKMAYHKVVDPQNYTIVFDLFTFDNNVNKLIEYMQNS